MQVIISPNRKGSESEFAEFLLSHTAQQTKISTLVIMVSSARAYKNCHYTSSIESYKKHVLSGSHSGKVEKYVRLFVHNFITIPKIKLRLFTFQANFTFNKLQIFYYTFSSSHKKHKVPNSI